MIGMYPCTGPGVAECEECGEHRHLNYLTLAGPVVCRECEIKIHDKKLSASLGGVIPAEGEYRTRIWQEDRSWRVEAFDHRGYRLEDRHLKQPLVGRCYWEDSLQGRFRSESKARAAVEKAIRNKRGLQDRIADKDSRRDSAGWTTVA